jgi:hypothetical protein
VHQIQPGPAVGELAVRPVERGPALEQRHDRVPFPPQQPVARRSARPAVDEGEGAVDGATPAPTGGANLVELEQSGRAPR